MCGIKKRWSIFWLSIVASSSCQAENSCVDRFNSLWRLSPSQLIGDTALSARSDEIRGEIRAALAQCADVMPVFPVSTEPGATPQDGSIMQLAVMLDDVELLREYHESGLPLEGLEHPIEGYSTLHVAVMFGAIDSARWLLSEGVDPNSRAVDGITPLMLASFRTVSQEEVAKMLFAAGADVFAVDEHGNSLEDLAKFSGDPRLVEWVQEITSSTFSEQ